jgi:uncharacterized radical SAM superfamily Fe-S cluster-containing enzyme
MSVQFSGGEPSISPHFIEANKYSRKVVYNSVQAATNGIEFARVRNSVERQLKLACVTSICSSTESATMLIVTARWVTCFDVKMRAINNLTKRE